MRAKFQTRLADEVIFVLEFLFIENGCSRLCYNVNTVIGAKMGVRILIGVVPCRMDAIYVGCQLIK